MIHNGCVSTSNGMIINPTDNNGYMMAINNGLNTVDPNMIMSSNVGGGSFNNVSQATILHTPQINGTTTAPTNILPQQPGKILISQQQLQKLLEQQKMQQQVSGGQQPQIIRVQNPQQIVRLQNPQQQIIRIPQVSAPNSVLNGNPNIIRISASQLNSLQQQQMSNGKIVVPQTIQVTSEQLQQIQQSQQPLRPGSSVQPIHITQSQIVNNIHQVMPNHHNVQQSDDDILSRLLPPSEPNNGNLQMVQPNEQQQHDVNSLIGNSSSQIGGNMQVVNSSLNNSSLNSSTIQQSQIFPGPRTIIVPTTSTNSKSIILKNANNVGRSIIIKADNRNNQIINRTASSSIISRPSNSIIKDEVKEVKRILYNTGIVSGVSWIYLFCLFN